RHGIRAMLCRSHPEPGTGYRLPKLRLELWDRPQSRAQERWSDCQHLREPGTRWPSRTKSVQSAGLVAQQPGRVVSQMRDRERLTRSNVPDDYDSRRCQDPTAQLSADSKALHGRHTMPQRSSLRQKLCKPLLTQWLQWLRAFFGLEY